MAGKMLPKQTIHKAVASFVTGMLGILGYYGLMPNEEIISKDTLAMVVINLVATGAVYLKRNYEAK